MGLTHLRVPSPHALNVCMAQVYTEHDTDKLHNNLQQFAFNATWDGPTYFFRGCVLDPFWGGGEVAACGPAGGLLACGCTARGSGTLAQDAAPLRLPSCQGVRTPSPAHLGVGRGPACCALQAV